MKKFSNLFSNSQKSPPSLCNLFSFLLALSLIFVLNVSPAFALTISSSTHTLRYYPPEDAGDLPGYSIDGGIYCYQGGTFRVDLTAEDYSGALTWTLKYNDCNKTTPSTEARLSNQTGKSVSVTGTLWSVVCNVIITVSDTSGEKVEVEFYLGPGRSNDEVSELTFTPNMNRLSRVDDATSQRIISYFRNNSDEDANFYSLFDTSRATMNTGSYSLTTEDAYELADFEEQVVLALPKTRVNTSGVYLVGISLEDFNTGDLFCLDGYLGNIHLDAGFFDRQGNILASQEVDGVGYYVVPADKYAVAAIYFDNSGEGYCYLTRYIGSKASNPITTEPGDSEKVPEVPISTLTSLPFVQQFAILTKIGDELHKIVSGDIKINLLEEENITSPKQPTQEMKQEAANQQLEFAYALNTITVSEDAYYIFKFDVPAELVGKKIADYKLFCYTDSVRNSVKASMLEIMEPLGVALDIDLMEVTENFGESMAIAILLGGGKSATLYVLKLILALLFGCSSVINYQSGFIIFTAVTGFIFMKFSIRRKR